MTSRPARSICIALALVLSPWAWGGPPAAAGQDDPRRLIDEPGERNLLGYGTRGIPEGPVENPSLGSTSNLGLPESETPAGASPAADTDTDTESAEP